MTSCGNLRQRWWFVTITLCVYGFFKEMRPSEPFLTESLTKYNNVTKDQVSDSVYPIWTYSYLALLVLVFLFTDLVKYKPMIIFEASGYMATWALLIWGSGVLQMQWMEFFYGIATSTEVAYYTYIYAKVDAAHYQRVTSYTRAAVLLGRFMSGVLSQSLVSSGALNFYQLNYISFTSVSVACLVALSLPSVERTFYFHRSSVSDAVGVTDTTVSATSDAPAQYSSFPTDNTEAYAGHKSTTHQTKPTTSDAVRNGPPISEHVGITRPTATAQSESNCSRAAALLVSDFMISYSTPSVVGWSVFWAFATCGYYQVGNYIQPLWEAVAPWEDFDSEGALYNGIVEACNTVLGAAAALLVGHLSLNWEFIGEPVLALLSFTCGGLLLAVALTSHIAVCYVFYALFRIIYQMSVTICSFQVMRQIPDGCFGLVFGINTFLALLLETILTLVVVDKHGFDLKPQPQFQIYGGYFIDLGVLYVFLVGYSIHTRGWERWKQQSLWMRPQQQRSDTSVA